MQGLVAVERTRQLLSCPQESTDQPLASSAVPEAWPARGEVTFATVDARYRPGLPLVVSSLHLTVPAGEKVGVCGRTGSGKSTVAKLLLRLLEVDAGSIVVDGIDIARLPLPTLRARVTMIPQDPVLWAGPLRYSLDPAGHCDDARLWQALEAVGLAGFVREGEGEGGDGGEGDGDGAEGQRGKGLDMEVAEGGENLSAGQRQLLCMARALIERPRVLVMDEATSNMDSKTDERIQSMLKGAFSDCTVLTIAHRIDTILWYDKVLVLDQGRVVEYDSPATLSAAPDSAFTALLREYEKGKSTTAAGGSGTKM